MRKHILSVLAALVLAGGGLTFFLGSSKAGPIDAYAKAETWKFTIDEVKKCCQNAPDGTCSPGVPDC
jgi:hypothetical protein